MLNNKESENKFELLSHPHYPRSRDLHKTPHPVLPQPRYGHSLLEETRLEKRELEDVVDSLRHQLVDYEEKVQYLQEQLTKKEIHHEDSIQQLRQRVSGTQRTTIQENVELIKLQREVRDKVSKLQNLQGKYQNLEDLLKKVKTSHEQVLEEMEKMTSKLKEEQLKNSSLSNELKQGNISQQSLAMKEEQIRDLREEVEMLKEAHGKLLHSTFDAEREREFRTKEKQYQLRIAQLEATIKADVSEKNDVLDKLTFERDTTDSSQKQLRELQVKYFALKEKHDDSLEKLKFFTGESAADFEEIQEALLLIKTRKERESRDLHFLEKVDDNVSRELQKENQQLQAAHADTINELEKTRSMLLIQHNINKDYQKEVEVTTKKMEELKNECDTRIEEYAQLLDIRAERIKKLEGQLKDVAYGTKQYKVKDDPSELLDDSKDSTVELERGQNIFEIHIGQIHITKEGVEEFHGVHPISFISYEFFEYELQATPVAQGVRPNYNHTSQYTIQVDDFFLHYLQKESMVLEFHQAIGTEYKTLAKGRVKFNELLDRSHGRLHGKIQLLCEDSDEEIVTVEYWMRLRVPMEQALRLYKERTKALGYITSNDLDKLDHPNSRSLKDSGINELKVDLVQCLKLKSSRKDVQPCPYCVYKFFDFADHDTDIVQSSTSPQFHDQRTFPVPMTEELDNYLKNSNLEVYVFDDADPEATNYIGKASIPLITLSMDKPLSGRFQLNNRNGQSSGVLEIALSWQYTYLPASAKKVRTYPKPVNTVVEHDEVFTPQKRGNTMQPMVSAGKLFEPKLEQKEEQREDVLEPTYERQRDGPRSNVNIIDSDSDSIIMPNERDRTMNMDDLAAASSTKKTSLPSTLKGRTGDGKKKKRKSTSSHLETDEDLAADSDEAFLEEELRRTAEAPIVESPVPRLKDTMFEESEEETDDDIVIPQSSRRPPPSDERQRGGGSQISVADSNGTDEDIVVTTSRPKSVARHHSAGACSITIIVSSLTLFDNSPVLEMDRIQQLFVSYKFLDCDPEQLETPISLPKPKANRSISFNFKKVFHVDEEDHETSRQFLMHLLMPDHPNEGRIFFTVVSDPMDDNDCEDVGIAYVDLIQLMEGGKDVIDADIDVYDLVSDGDDSGDVIGSLTVTVQALDALQSLYE